MTALAVDTCFNCDGYGLVYAPVDDWHDWRYGKLFPCPVCDKGRQIKEDRLRRVFGKSGIPDGYIDLTLASFERLPAEYKAGKWLGYGAMLHISGGRDCRPQTHKFTLADAYNTLGVSHKEAKGRGIDLDAPEYTVKRNWVVLYGTNGTGKTALSAILARALANKGVSVLFLRVQDYLEAVRNSYQDDAQTRTESVVEAAQKVDYLILDEFYEPNLKPHTVSRIEELVRYRYNWQKPLWTTTNMNIVEFKKYWGSQIGSVVADAHWIPHGGLAIRQESTGKVVSL